MKLQLLLRPLVVLISNQQPIQIVLERVACQNGDRDNSDAQ